MMTIREFFDWAEKEGFADMEYELKLDDLLKSLTELGIDTDKLTIVEKSEKFVLSVYANQGESSYASEMNVDKDREEVDLC